MMTLDRWIIPDYERVLSLFQPVMGTCHLVVPILRDFEGHAYSYEEMLANPELACCTGDYEVFL